MSFAIVADHPVLYARGVRGEVRVWRMQEGYEDSASPTARAGHRVVSGIEGGAMVESGWTFCEAKNVGKKNATTPFEQAKAEVKALYDIRLAGKYFTSVEDIDKVPFLKPMLAVDYDKRLGKFDLSKGVYAQPKLDGIRCIARADGLWTRTGKPIVSVPHIFEALVPLFDKDPELVLDGELYNHDLKDDFNTLVSIVRKAKPKPEDIEAARVMQYHVYDMPSHPGSFMERYSAMFAAGAVPEGVVPVETTYSDNQAHLDQLNALWLNMGYEGQMVRLPGVGYENKRSNSLLKRKQWITDEFPVLSLIEGNGNWAGAAKTAVVRLPNGSEGEATFTGEYQTLQDLLQSGEVPDWATVKYFGFTADGKLRFPNVVDYGFGQRED